MHSPVRWILPALVLILAAWDSSPSGGDAGALALSALTCDVDGVNTDPFTVADAVADGAT